MRDTDITLITPATHMTKLLISCLKGQLLELKTSENYTCFLPNEIMSIHWTEEQATVFSVVLVKINGVVREDHSLLGKTIRCQGRPFCFYQQELKHAIPFVEIVIVT